MAFFEVLKNFEGDVSEEIQNIYMPYADRLEKELLDISRTPRYFGCIYRFENVVFFIESGKLYVTYYDGDEHIPSYTEEERMEVERITTKLKLDREIFLPAKCICADNILEKLIEYYTDIDDGIKEKRDFWGLVAWEAVKRAKARNSGCFDFSDVYEKELGTEVTAIKKLIEELSREDSIFYKRELVFLSILLGGIPCVNVKFISDHSLLECIDEEKIPSNITTFYYSLAISVDAIDCFPMNKDFLYNMEYLEEACKAWFDIILHIDDYILYQL